MTLIKNVLTLGFIILSFITFVVLGFMGANALDRKFFKNSEFIQSGVMFATDDRGTVLNAVGLVNIKKSEIKFFIDRLYENEKYCAIKVDSAYMVLSESCKDNGLE